MIKTAFSTLMKPLLIETMRDETAKGTGKEEEEQNKEKLQ